MSARMTDADLDEVCALLQEDDISFEGIEELYAEARRAREAEEKAARDIAHWKMELAEVRRERDSFKAQLVAASKYLEANVAVPEDPVKP